MRIKKIRRQIFLPLLFMASQSAYAVYTLDPATCPAGTTGTLAGIGYISAGTFFPATFGSPVYDCTTVPVVSAPTIQTLQIERTTSNLTNQHIMDKVVHEYGSNSPGAASGDSNDYKPDAVWGETNLSSLTEHNSKVPGFASNIYQFVGGLDKRHGDLFYGAALTYAYTDNNLIANTDNVMHTVGVTPYMAYKINDFLFASGLGTSFSKVRTSSIVSLRIARANFKKASGFPENSVQQYPSSSTSSSIKCSFTSSRICSSVISVSFY